MMCTIFYVRLMRGIRGLLIGYSWKRDSFSLLNEIIITT